jgi:hypothetical protein
MPFGDGDELVCPFRGRKKYCHNGGQMSRMAHDGLGRGVDPRGSVNDSEQAELPVEPDQSDEARRTCLWRLDQFGRLGFDFARAAMMADDSQIDLALARRLIALGCPLETAARILL